MNKRLLAALVAVLLIGSSASAMAPAARRAAVLAGRSAGAYSARRVGAVAAPIFRSRAAAVMAPAGTRGISIEDFTAKGGLDTLDDNVRRMYKEAADARREAQRVSLEEAEKKDKENLMNFLI